MEADMIERWLGSDVTSTDADRWNEDSYGPEQSTYVTSGPLAPLPGDVTSSLSAPRLSQPPSRADSGEGTPPYSDPSMARPRISGPGGSGFYSGGYSPLSDQSGSRSETPRTPPFDDVINTQRSFGRLAISGGSRTASRSASEPGVDSRFIGETPEPSACEMIQNPAGEFRSASVLSRASSLPELACDSPMSWELFQPVMIRSTSRGTLRAPVSGGESPAGMSPGETTPVSALFDTEEPSSEQIVPITNVHRSASGRSGDSSRRSPGTPELRRPLLAHTVYRELELPSGERSDTGADSHSGYIGKISGMEPALSPE